MAELDQDALSSKGEKVILFAAGFCLFLILLVTANWILPKNCLLYEYRQVGFLCDGIDLNNPAPCSVCEDDRLATVARLFFLLAFGILLLPFFVLGIRWWRQTRDEKNSIES